MFLRKLRLPFFVLAVIALAANFVWALNFELGETKQQLKLEYDVVVKDIGANGYLIDLTIANQGRMKPLSDVGLCVYGKEMTNQGRSPVIDLALSLAPRKEGDKLSVHFQLNREWAERAEISLLTSHLDDQKLVESCYHVIRLREHLKK